MHIVLLGAFCILHSDQDESFRFDYFFRLFPCVYLQGRAAKADNATLGYLEINFFLDLVMMIGVSVRCIGVLVWIIK